MALLLTVSGTAVLKPQSAYSQKENLKQKFGVEDTIHIYPGKVKTDDWEGIDDVLVPDLKDDDLYQRFTDKNSAYIQLKEPEEIMVPTPGVENDGVGGAAATDQVIDDTQSVIETEVTSEPATVAEPETQPEPEPAVETDTEAENNNDATTTPDPGETTVYKRASESTLALFNSVVDLFPFVNAATTTEVSDTVETSSEDIEVSPSGPLVDDINDEPVSDVVETAPETDTAPAVVDSSSTTTTEETEVKAEVDVSEEAQVPVGTETGQEITSPTGTEPVLESEIIVGDSSNEVNVVSTDQATTTSTTTTAAEVDLSEPVETLPENFETYSITLSDFSMPELKSGETITSVQLRASLAAKYDLPASTTAPFFKLTYDSPSTTYTLGSVLVEDEVSNAINGGYYLFALPQNITLEDFKDINITVEFVGDKEMLDGAFLDALWFEINTIRVTKDDLLKRAEAEVLDNLGQPSYYEFVNKKLNFKRDESLVFNLKYLSQRSRSVEAIREFLGQRKIKIEEANVLHHSSGLVGIVPEITVTAEGLVTVVIPDSDKQKMKPGQYTIDFVINEGGVTLHDSFDFQWGMLSINPDQATAVNDEVVNISMGALTPNGNTVCNADLRLYHVMPDGFINEIKVDQSGKCEGNNVIDVPDYTATVIPKQSGTHELYLERLNEMGQVVSHTETTFLSEVKPPLSIVRNGPTRIYPPAPYPMTLMVRADKSFTGTLTERVPSGFVVFNTDAEVKDFGSYQELRWNVELLAGSSKTVSYTFDAPDLSPYLYEIGPAALNAEGKNNAAAVKVNNNASTTASTTSVSNVANGKLNFVEHRTWQIASDATGNMLIFYDGNNIPTADGWTCLSCGSGAFFQTFVVGSSTYSGTAPLGSASHTPTAVGSVNVSSDSDAENRSGTTVAGVAHTHTYSPTIASASNLPNYRQLRVLQYTSSTGEPPTLPTGTIGIFDVASSSLPAGWMRYSDHDGYYVRAEDTIGSTGGSNTHTHAITGTTGAAAGTTEGNRGGGTAGEGAAAGHTHGVSTSTPTLNNEPPYIEVVLARLTATSTAPNNLITMWTDAVPSGWVDVSSDPSDPFNNKFIKAATTYGGTGGAATHTHNDMNSVVSQGPSGTAVTTRTGSFGAAFTHTHLIDITSFSTDNHLPPYTSAVFGKRQGTDPVYDQLSFRWYANESSQTPTDPWPSGASDLAEGVAIDGNTTVVNDGDRLRLRINTQVTNATSTVGSKLKLQYAAADTCSSASGWTVVGTTASSTIWRGYDNSAVDHSTLSSTTLASTTVPETYEESGTATGTPNQIGVDGVGEWDFVIEHNGAAAGTNYCFRLIEADGTAFSTYSTYPELLTNSAPNAPTLSKLFDNEKTASTSLKFQFVTSDPESEDLQYQVQIDNNYDFGSTVEDRNSVSNSAQFENQVVTSDKAPFTSGQLMEFTAASTFTNGTTYYWRVRAQDPNGSGEWGEWSEIRSFTIDTTLTASAWFQTETEQFDTNTLEGIDTASNQMDLAIGSTTGTTTSTAITFTDGELGTAWDSFTFNDTETAGDVKYTIQYYTDAATWANIPDTELAGNSAGFDTSPVSLLDLNVDDYGIIRIVGVLNDSAGSPSVQDWTINWGYRVDTPTITKLFPNEKTGTTTPTLEFTTVDPQAFDLTYEVSWSTDINFTASTTRVSDTHTGFVNIDDGGDNDPFTSGDTIQFTVDGADALTNNTTYWWRVRAYNATSTSFWTEAQSFTVDTIVVASTWFQTTAEQFDTNVLSGTISLDNDTVSVATTASEAIVVYGEGTATTPKYREWNGTSWSSEGNMLDVGAPLVWSIVKAGTTREEYVAATVDTGADLNVQVFSLGEWGDQQELTTNVGNVNARGFDIAYETVSGDALVVYCNNAADPEYYVWNGSSWTAGTGPINVAETTNCDWIKLASDPASDEIIMLMRGTDGNPYEAQVWSGAAWGNSTTLGNIIDSNHEGMAVGYEESGGQALIVTSDGQPARFEWNSWNGTAWAAAGTQAIGNDLEWGTLVSAVGSDQMALCYQDDDVDIGTVRWSGSAWTWSTADEHQPGNGYVTSDPGFSCAFEDGGSIVTAFTTSTSTNFARYTTGWAIDPVNSISTSVTSELQRTGVGLILGVFFDVSANDLLYSNWNGSSWSTTGTLENDASVDTTPYGRPFSLAPRNSGTEGTVIVSPGIDFDDGSGPYWQSMSWNDSTPGTSDILYSMQYQTATGSWQFIPDSEIPGNSVGTSTGTIDLSGLNKNTYNVIRPYAALSCDGSGNCPQIQDWTVQWAEGITVSGTLSAYDQTTIATGTIAVAVNGVLQTGKTGASSNGVWSIPNVTVFPGDIVTVFVSDTGESTEAVGVTRYDGIGDITGFQLYERHLALGSNDATSTPLTNSDIAVYNYTNDEDVFFDTSGSTLDLCVENGCGDVELFINASTTYTPGGNLVTSDIEINGTLTATTTLYIEGSWDNNATSTLTGSSVVFTATSSAETIDNTGASVSSFNNVTFGTTTTATASWTLASDLDVNNDLLVSRGTLARGSSLITIAGDLTNGANGYWTGIGTTTFDGSAGATWSDQNATLQNVGNVLVDGSNKVVTLAGNVAANNLTIGANDTLDSSASNYDITVYGDWTNNNNFVARSGEVFMAATTSGRVITTNGDDFYDLSFTGVGGDWSFSEGDVIISHDFNVATGTVTLATSTTSVGGSWSSVGGTFAHNNAAVYFTGNGAETISASTTDLNNAFYDMYFTGSGSWGMLDLNATSSNDVVISDGTVTFPAGTFTIGGSIQDTGGAFDANLGTIRLDSIGAESIQAGGSSFSNLTIDGSGGFTFLDTDATIAGDLNVNAGTLTLPTGTLYVGGSWGNSATVVANGGEVYFNSDDTGETVDFGNSEMYDVRFESTSGGWTISTHATATNNFTLASSSDFTLSAAQVLSVGATFTNLVGGASTTWTGSTLSLESGAYTINTKLLGGDTYDNLRIAAAADIKMWNSSASTYNVVSGGSLYSQDHAGTDGDLYIFGDYQRTSGNEYWSYATDFDGTDLTGGSERQANVYFASGATASLSDSLLEMVGASAASSTVQNQGAGTYTVSVSGGTTTAQYYDLSDLGSTGLSLLASTTVTSLRDGYFTVAAAGGTALTVSSTTIDTNPAKQIYNVAFATTTAISANNVTQTDGVPTSYWWFRNSYGNLDGEGKDNDTGNPGSIRWDDSALVLTISGVVYDTDESTPLGGTTCDGDADTPIRIVVEDGATYDGQCQADGSFSVPGVTVVGDPVITVFLNNAPGGENAVGITKTATANISDFDLYVNRVITRHEDVTPMTIADMAVYDSSDDPDIQFTATVGVEDALVVNANNELHVWATTTFTPGGVVTLAADATGNAWDGSLHLGEDAIFTGAGTTTYTVGGSLTLERGASYVPASTTIDMIATTTGKTITTASNETLTVNQLQFTGVGGGWNLNGNATATADVYVETGTLTGTGSLELENGSFYGNGLVSLGGGEVYLHKSNTLGGTQGWTFNDLTLGSGSVVGTTTPGSNATTTVGGVLTISNAHFLDAGSSAWDLSGTGNVFVETGNLLEDTSSFTYSGTGATNVISTDYYDLHLNAAGGTPTYTATGFGVQVFGDLTVGGADTTTVNFDTNDSALNVDGDLYIYSNGTFIASGSGSFTLAGNYDNDGTYTASGGTLTFDGAGTSNIAAGSSDFATVDITGSGDFTVTEHATATTAFTIGSSANSFTLSSGQTLAVGGTFTNSLGGAATTWTGSTLYLYGGGNYEINDKTIDDTYATLDIADGTQIRMWNSSAGTVNTLGTGSLYSMDHANTAGDLYIYGAYSKTSGTDHWSYATDFDASDLSGGSERKVDVYIEGTGSVAYEGSSNLMMLGVASASTTLQNQGSGVYAMTIGGSASTTMNYYEVTDIDSDGLTFTATPTVHDLSYGYFLVANDSDTAITVGGTAINTSPALTFTRNIFATSSGVTNAFNVTATGTSVSSWRFTNHQGDIDGENFDVDPDGDPGYVVWDDSAANITISGTVYTGEGSGVPGASICDDVTNSVDIVVAGLTTYNATCGTGTGDFSVSGISYSPGDTIIAYLTAATGVEGATVTIDPVSNINNFDIYQNRVIVRHEGTNPITIADMAVWDSSNDGNIPFTAVDSTPDTLTLPADRKLIVWNNKEFAPGGNTTLTSGGSQSYGGALELYSGATYTAAPGETLSVGGSLTSQVGATYDASTATTTFTTTGAGRTIDINDGSFYNVEFTGSGDWAISDNLFDINNFDQSAGTLTLPTGTTTVSGYWSTTAGTFNHNGSLMVFDGTAAGNTLAFAGSDVAELKFTGSGSWTMDDTNATSTNNVTIENGTLTLPSGSLTVEGSFRNEGGAITHNSSELILATSTVATLLASSSDLYSVTFRSGGTYDMVDQSLALLGDLTISSGSLDLATGTLSIGGSLDASGGTFAHNSTGTVLFNSTDTGETIDPGVSDFYNVVFGSATGGWTITANATTTRNFTLTTANDFTLQSGATLYVGNVFDNSVGGAATTWDGSTLILDSGNSYSINDKLDNGDDYENLVIGADSDIEAWFSSATSTNVASSSSFYSMDNGGVDGALYIYGDYHIDTASEFWSYANDFDGDSLLGSERAVTVYHADGATTTVDGGTLNIVGTSGNETTITNQGSGTYGMAVSAGTFNAQYYAYRNLNSTGLALSGTPVISSLNYGDFELAVNGGRLIDLAAATLNANASLIITGARFATTTAITGTNVYLTGVTSNAWTFVSHTGNLDGEDFDVDGATACGQVRWDDSSCLLVQQTHYRWRNDDGGLGVPNTEWYDASWGKRKPVYIDNNDGTTYTDAVVELTVAYDADMQGDFDDLRFTDDTGTSITPHFIASTTVSTAEVWVKVPSLPANDTAVVYMYYDNAVATSSSSSTLTFIAADDFEDNNISEYSGDNAKFAVTGAFAYGGSYGLDNSPDETDRAVDGIARFDQTVSQGETIRYMQYVNTTGSGGADEVCTIFAAQSPVTANQNYAVCLEQTGGTDFIALVEDVVDTAVYSGTVLASSTVSYTSGWYEIEVDWGTDDSIFVSLYDDNETLIATTSATDVTYTSGGYGFTFWSNYGGWDNFTSRPTLNTEPSVRYGAESVSGGASWLAAQDTGAVLSAQSTYRLRIAIENSGLAITNQTFDLEYAEKGAAPSCESVASGNYVTMPNQASCGTSPLCMQTTGNYADGAVTTDLLTGTAGDFTAGRAVESPDFTTDNINLNQDTYTELEYAIVSTNYATSTDYCLRVTDGGTELDTYLRVAEIVVKFDPILGVVYLDDRDAIANINLVGGTTTRVYATSTVTDYNGYSDMVAASTTFYHSDETAACAEDPNNCYISTSAASQCNFTNCSGNSCLLECYADFEYHASPTDDFGGKFWYAFMEVEDTQGGTDFDTSFGQDVTKLAALNVLNPIAYTSLAASSTSSTTNATTVVENIGNTHIDVTLTGTDMSDGLSSVIPASYQRFSSSTFNYDACTNCKDLSSTTPKSLNIDLTKPTSTAISVVDDVYWGIKVPFGIASNPHSGVNTFYAVSN